MQGLGLFIWLIKTRYLNINYAGVARVYFPVKIPSFYVEYWSVYVHVFIILSKWYSFYSNVPSGLVTTSAVPSDCQEGGKGGLCCARKLSCAQLGGGVDSNG